MKHPEANITIKLEADGKTSVAVLMPVWVKTTEYGTLKISLPLLGLDTYAKNEEDADNAIDEAIIAFCVMAKKYGQGVQKELQSLGWQLMDDSGQQPALGYCVSDTDSLLERLFQTGDSYAKSNLLLEAA